MKMISLESRQKLIENMSRQAMYHSTHTGTWYETFRPGIGDKFMFNMIINEYQEEVLKDLEIQKRRRSLFSSQAMKDSMIPEELVANWLIKIFYDKTNWPKIKL